MIMDDPYSRDTITHTKGTLLRMPYVNLTKIYEKKCFTLTLQISTGI